MEEHETKRHREEMEQENRKMKRQRVTENIIHLSDDYSLNFSDDDKIQLPDLMISI